MKKYILIPVLAVVAMLFVNPASAQETSRWALQWNISIPTSDFENYINETSIRGLEFGGEYQFETNVTVGGSAGYGAFFKKTDKMTVDYENNTITAIQFRDLYSWYFLAEAGYAYNSDFIITPYAKIGIGTYYTEQQLEIGLLYWEEQSWDFGMRPEIGAFMEIPDSGFGFIVNAKYNTVFNYGNDLKNLNYFTIGLGVVFGM
jgi:opacity protein-like surface antigen